MWLKGYKNCHNIAHHTHALGCGRLHRHSSVTVVHATPNVQQALLLFVDVMHSLLNDTQYLVVNQTGLGCLVAPDLVQCKRYSLLEKSYSGAYPMNRDAVNV